jgi:hypothetical protein
MSGFLHDSSAILTHFERKSLIMPDRRAETVARVAISSFNNKTPLRHNGAA